jgi:hypothetical protein
MKEPVIVDCGKAPTAPCPYRVGPHGHPKDKAITLVRPFRSGPDAGSGVAIQVYPKSHTGGGTEGTEVKHLVLKWQEVMIIWGNLVFKFPNEERCGILIFKGYSGASAFIEEGKDLVVSFMR